MIVLSLCIAGLLYLPLDGVTVLRCQAVMLTCQLINPLALSHLMLVLMILEEVLQLRLLMLKSPKEPGPHQYFLQMKFSREIFILLKITLKGNYGNTST